MNFKSEIQMAMERDTARDKMRAISRLVADDVLTERFRQIEVEGYKPEHDDAHDCGQLADAAACYATDSMPLENWPWEWSAFKRRDRRSDLVRAAALLLAEIERLDRSAT